MFNRMNQSDHLSVPTIVANPGASASAILPSQQAGVKDVDIVDIKWCPAGQVFLILFQRHLFTFDPKTKKFTQLQLVRHKDYPSVFLSLSLFARLDSLCSSFRCLSCLNDSSLYISYCVFGICIELWKYPSVNTSNSFSNAIKRWDRLANDKTEWVSHMDSNSASQIGLLVRTASSIHTRFELRDEHLTLLKQIALPDDFVDLFYPFRLHQWFLKGSSGKSYLHSSETQTTEPSSFEFPFGIQEFGANSMLIGHGQNELTLCDV